MKASSNWINPHLRTGQSVFFFGSSLFPMGDVVVLCLCASLASVVGQVDN